MAVFYSIQYFSKQTEGSDQTALDAQSDLWLSCPYMRQRQHGSFSFQQETKRQREIQE